jgi:SET domain-containing protein
VFASRSFKKDELIAENPIVLVTFDKIKDSELCDYSMSWDDSHDSIALGEIQLINHSEDSNCRIEDDYENLTKRLFASRDIAQDEHLTVHYRCELWFEPIKEVSVTECR